MKAKLTLTVDKELIEEAKEYAQSSGMSLSTIIERYLRSLLDERQSQDRDHSPVVDVSGMMHLDRDFDLSGDYSNYLLDRYQ